MRQPFNTFCDVYSGPGTSFPGSFVGTFPCRFVVEDAILPSLPGSPEIIAYLTIEAYNPRGVWTTPFFGADPDLSDRIEVANRPGVTYWVVYSDVINWHSQAPYYRSYLATDPIPPIGPRGGLLFGGQASVRVSRVVPVSGGLELGGGASWRVSRVVPVSGGLELGGSATWSFTPGVTDYNLDHYTDTNGTLATAHTPDIGPSPTSTVSKYQIQSNHLVVSGNTAGSSPYNPLVYESSHSDGTISADITNATQQQASDPNLYYDAANLVFRYVNDNNYWMVQQYMGGLRLSVRVSGTFTIVANPSQSATNNTTYNYKVELLGSSIKVYRDGVQKITYSDSTHVSATKHGVVTEFQNPSGSSATTVDNYNARP